MRFERPNLVPKPHRFPRSQEKGWKKPPDGVIDRFAESGYVDVFQEFKVWIGNPNHVFAGGRQIASGLVPHCAVDLFLPGFCPI
jgi:hypothetical protein